MSDEVELPGEKELAQLPKGSTATFAIRCALKVQLLLAAGDEATDEFKKQL